MKRIGIDCDGVVADYMAGASPLLQERYGLTPDLETEAYSIEEIFGLTADNWQYNIRQDLYLDQHLFANLPPLEEQNSHLTSHLRNILGPNIKIYFVTARDNHPVIMEDTRKWLDQNTSTYDDVFHVDNKAEFCKLAGIQVMIEDEPRQITKLVDAGIDVIMRDQPWNRHLTENPRNPKGQKGRLTRVYNWKEMVAIAEEYYRE